MVMTAKSELPYHLRRRMPIEVFTRLCGYFTSRTHVNNGYGCLHPENEEQYEGDVIPRCYTWSCPLAYEVDPNDGNDHVVTWRRTPNVSPLRNPEAESCQT